MAGVTLFGFAAGSAGRLEPIAASLAGADLRCGGFLSVTPQDGGAGVWLYTPKDFPSRATSRRKKIRVVAARCHAGVSDPSA